MRKALSSLCVLGLAASADAAAADGCGSLSSLEWLLGEWVADGSKSSFHENWTALGPNTWEGRGVETSKSDPGKQSSEVLRLVEMGGGVFYVSKVSHNELPVAFRLSECRDGRFAFANPAHDFPRRVEYLKRDDGGLSVRVSDGAEKGFTLEFERQAPSSDVTDAVLAAEDARFAAMVKANPVAMRRWLADDLAYVHMTGEVEDREQLIASIASGSKRYRAVVPGERRVVFTGPGFAYVQGRARFVVSAGAKQHGFEARYLAVYRLIDGDWRLGAWQSLRLP